jgi:RimJ/RimL family protein N-acetyltransferase
MEPTKSSEVMSSQKQIMHLQSRLEGQKIYIRPFVASDITSEYLGWLNNKIVTKYSNQRFKQHTLESSINYVTSFQNTSNHFLAICNYLNNNVVGTLTVYHSTQHGTADIGILVGDPESWGTGIGLDAFKTVVLTLEKCSSVRKICAGTVRPNTRMVKIIEKTGLFLEATRRNHEIFEGQPVDILLYAKLCN